MSLLQANVPSELGSEGNKQHVPKIISALHGCISRLPRDALRSADQVTGGGGGVGDGGGAGGIRHGTVLSGWDHTVQLTWLIGGFTIYIHRTNVHNIRRTKFPKCAHKMFSFLILRMAEEIM